MHYLENQCGHDMKMELNGQRQEEGKQATVKPKEKVIITSISVNLYVIIMSIFL